jgi:hypothetical protein
MKRLLLASGILLAMVAALRAEDLILAWDFPASFTPTPESFLVSYRSSTAPMTVQQFRVPNQGRASCDGVTGVADLTPDSVCGRPPDCLPPALYVFVVQAEVGELRSPESHAATCEALAGCTYDCQGVSLPPALQHLAQSPQGNHPPDPREVEEAVTTLAGRPTSPTLPSVTAPAPTVADIPDTVVAALNQLPKAPV